VKAYVRNFIFIGVLEEDEVLHELACLGITSYGKLNDSLLDVVKTAIVQISCESYLRGRICDLPCAFKPRLELRSRNSIAWTEGSLQILLHSLHPSRNISSNLLVILVLEAVCDVVSPICRRTTGMIWLGIGAAASCFDMTWSRIKFEELDDTVWLKNAVYLAVSVQIRLRERCDLQTNILKEGLVALNFVKDVSSTNEAIKVVRNWLGVLEKLVYVANRELRVLLRDMDGAEVVAHWLGMVGLHKISALKSAFLWEIIPLNTYLNSTSV
jgi:hypothetical protein